MKVIRKNWPKVREVEKKGKTYYVVDLRKKGHKATFKWFSVKNEALEFASDMGAKVTQSGIQSLGFDPRIKPWEERAALFGHTLDEVVEAGLGHFAKHRKVKDSAFLSELLTLWIDDKTTDTLKPLRERSAKTIRAMGNMFKADFKDLKIVELTEDRIEKYLTEKDVSNQTKKNLRNYLNQFFNWAVKKKYHDHNPAQGLKVHVQNGVPEFYTVDECKTIMTEMLNEANRPLVPYFSLCLFAGIRPLECERMEWDKNVKLDTKEVYVNAAISKTKKDRLFVMSDNLVKWLELAKDQKPLIPANFRKLKEKALKGVKNVEFIADGLRHTFSTFHYAKHKSLEELRHIMGNSPGVIERFYKGTISQVEIEKFWSITPDSLKEK